MMNVIKLRDLMNELILAHKGSAVVYALDQENMEFRPVQSLDVMEGRVDICTEPGGDWDDWEED